jgi:hypothetical protein
MLNILITATPRIELHENCCLKFIKLISEYETVNVVLNLDIPELLKDISDDYLDKCIQNFQNIPNINFYYQIVKENCSFRNAAKNVVMKSYEISNENDLFLWLEDDWSFESQKFTEFYKKYTEFFKSEHEYFLLFAYIPTGNPFIYRYTFFNKQISWYKENDKLIDPELLIWKLAFSSKKQQNNALKNAQKKKRPVINAMFMPLFFDMGRDWRKTKSIHKIDKHSSNNTTWYL